MASPFPVLASALEAYRLVFGNLGAFCRAAFLPLLLVVLLVIARIETGQYGAFSYLYGYAYLLLPVANLIPCAIFAVSWHRFLLLGTGDGRPPWLPLPRTRHLQVILYGALALLLETVARIGLYILFVSLFGAYLLGEGFSELASFWSSMALSLAFSLLLALTLGALLARLSLVIPAVSLGRGRSSMSSLAGSWDRTAGQAYRIVTAWILAFAPFSTLALALDAEPTLFRTLMDLAAGLERQSMWHPYLDEAVIDSSVAGLDFLCLALAVTILSRAYWHSTQGSGALPTEAAEGDVPS